MTQGGFNISEFKYIELFAGIGGFRSALDSIGGECVFASEIDPFATISYKALYNGAPELHGDITKIAAEDIPEHDVLVGGFPCQAFSVAGQRKGFADTRGTLFFEIARIASVKKPRLMLLENVKGLLSHNQGRTFETMCAALNEIGYAVDFKIVNSKYFNVPQNRERIYIVCDRDADHESWEVVGNDVSARAKRRVQALGVRTFNFDWPESHGVTKRLRDILETDVAEKYYLSESKTAKLIAEIESRGSLGTTDANSVNVVGSLGHYGNDQMNRVYSVDGQAPTIIAVSGGGRETKILKPSLEQFSFGEGIAYNIDDSYAKGTSLGDVGKGRRTHVLEHCPVTKTEVRPVLTPDRAEKRQNGRRFKDNDEESFTLTAQDRHGIAVGRYPRYRIRKLTPLECWRLQGFTDAQHAKAVAAGVSDSQLYKQAGNAVTVTVIKAIAPDLVFRLLL